MYVKRNSQSWRNRWPWNWLYPPIINERFCRKCNQPYQDGPMPKERLFVEHGNVCGLVYPAASFRSKDLVIRLGRWRASNGKFFCSEYIPVEEWDDLQIVLQKMQAAFEEERRTRARR